MELGGVTVRPNSGQVILKAIEGHPVQVESEMDYVNLYRRFRGLKTTREEWAKLGLIRRKIAPSRWVLSIVPKLPKPPKPERPAAVKPEEIYRPQRGPYQRQLERLVAGDALTFADEAAATEVRDAWERSAPASHRQHQEFTIRALSNNNAWIALLIERAAS